MFKLLLQPALQGLVSNSHTSEVGGAASFKLAFSMFESDSAILFSLSLSGDLSSDSVISTLTVFSSTSVTTRGTVVSTSRDGTASPLPSSTFGKFRFFRRRRRFAGGGSTSREHSSISLSLS